MKGLLSALAVMLLLLGCSTPMTAPERAPLMRVFHPHFTLEGRLALSDGTQSAHMGVLWTHAPTQQRVDIRSPLGQVLLRIEEKEGRAFWQEAQGLPQYADDLDALASHALGFPVPVKALVRWVQAAHLHGEVREVDPLGRPLHLIEEGWSVRYLAYANTDPPALAAVRRLELQRGTWQLRLVVDRWASTADSEHASP